MLPTRSISHGVIVLCAYLAVCTLPASADPQPACDNSTNPAGKTFQLCSDFRDLRDVLPANTLAYLTTKHYRSDAKFRKAMNFMKTAQFASIAQQISQSNVYQQLLQQFIDAGVSTNTIGSIANIMNCLLLPEPRYSADRRDDASQSPMFVVPRSLQTFAVEVMAAIPREKFAKELDTKLDESEQFYNFYKIASNSAFQKSVFDGFSSYQLTYPLSVLKRNNINLRKLVSTIFQVLSWGPAI